MCKKRLIILTGILISLHNDLLGANLFKYFSPDRVILRKIEKQKKSNNPEGMSEVMKYVGRHINNISEETMDNLAKLKLGEFTAIKWIMWEGLIDPKSPWFLNENYNNLSPQTINIIRKTTIKNLREVALCGEVFFKLKDDVLENPHEYSAYAIETFCSSEYYFQNPKLRQKLVNNLIDSELPLSREKFLAVMYASKFLLKDVDPNKMPFYSWCEIALNKSWTKLVLFICSYYGGERGLKRWVASEAVLRGDFDLLRNLIEIEYSDWKMDIVDDSIRTSIESGKINAFEVLSDIYFSIKKDNVMTQVTNKLELLNFYLNKPSCKPSSREVSDLIKKYQKTLAGL